MHVDPHTLALVLHPAEILRKKAEPVNPSDPQVQAVAARMMELMRVHEGAGLAAPQVGVPWRLFVTRDPEDPQKAVAWMNPTLEIVNPTIESEEEGCLSLPDIRAEIKRPVGIKISGWNASGEPVEQASEAFVARVWQHENDHLDGILIIDKMSAMDRLVNRRALKYLERLAT
ncbi:MAG: peptide deformylase [Phycisphaerales bacterium]|jgi:peptide deformylase|nr:peptide deformylase [Phycisphaerales bacterium]